MRKPTAASIDDLKAMVLFLRRHKTAEQVAREVGVTRDVIMRLSRGDKVARRTSIKVIDAYLKAEHEEVIA